ncbi:uncharacterized protein LOC113278432 isoform X2 [Papaver somniferum]|uniref:uncharacterized protein LOC113278432 isoform X2 n=1 Tax=Papaver somniferum TaxID=3469 RepID=UPI000E705100|nr:uncharacterized protein LOC113278432 isoform X2 [Papaver somniferum]
MADRGNTGGGAAGSRRSTRSRAADHHANVDDEENVFGDLGDLVNVGNTCSGRRRSIWRKDLNPLLVYENLAAEIGGNLVNPADPNVFPQQNPAARGGSADVMAAAPIGEVAPRNQGRRRDRHDQGQNPLPPQQRRTRTRREAAQNPQPPQPQVPIEHEIPGMAEIPAHLRDPPHRLYRLCRKKITKSDLKTLNITGDNRPFLKHMAKEACLALGSGPGLRVNVQVLNPAPLIGTVLFLRNPGGDSLTLAWRELFTRMGCRLASEKYIDMWFEMAPPTMNIYIQGR